MITYHFIKEDVNILRCLCCLEKWGLRFLVRDDASFSTGTGLERVGVVGLDQDCWWAELKDAGSFGLG